MTSRMKARLEARREALVADRVNRGMEDNAYRRTLAQVPADGFGAEVADLGLLIARAEFAPETVGLRRLA